MVPKKFKALWWGLGGLGILFLLSSIAISLIEYRRFSERPRLFPAGSSLAGVPVGGLSEAEATARVTDFYQQPLVLDVGGATVLAPPADLGFQLDVPALVQTGLVQAPDREFWPYLWQRDAPGTPIEMPLDANVDRAQIETYLQSEIAPRYTQPALPLRPIPFTTNFQPGTPGTRLDLESAVANIEAALRSPTTHRASVPIIEDPLAQTNDQALIASLRHNTDLTGFDGLVELYLQSLETDLSLHMAFQNDASVAPDIAFTAASTIKIPIMISVLRRLPEPTPQEALTLMEQMIILSENPPADTLMEAYLDPVRGPLIVTDDMQALGLDNTFMGGYFYPGAPLLERYETPANTRTDIFLDPDPYSQTTPAEAGQLLAAIYQCAADGSGLLTDTFPDEITRTECQLMVDILSANQIGLLIEAGLPPEATVAHKHGWVLEPDGILRPMSDAALVFTPGGDYVLNIFIYDPQRLDFDQGNRLIARLSQTVYNFFNLEQRAYWWVD